MRRKAALRRARFTAKIPAIVVLLFTALPTFAHVVSMSTGELRVDGPTAVYELRMPMYEIASLADPQAALLDHIRFENAIRTSAECHAEDATYVCRANYEFPGLFDRLGVDCTFYQVTVPNHVHLLTATLASPAGDAPAGQPHADQVWSDQAVFDQSFTHAQVRFHPPSRAEVTARDLGAGLWRAATSAAGLLFLISLVIAARSGRETILLTSMFLAGEWAIRSIAPLMPWQFSPRFLDAAMALAVAYLAVETLALPEAGFRWLVVFVIGLLHRLYFAGYPGLYLTGAAFFEIALILPLYLVARRIGSVGRTGAAWMVLAASAGWFAIRLVR